MGNYCCCLDTQYNQAKTTEESIDEIENRLEKNKWWPTRRKRTVRHRYSMKSFHSGTAEEDPTIARQRWYYGKMSRRELFSTPVYSKMEPGTYLVRKPISVNDCPYVLSVVDNRDVSSDSSENFFVKHVKIFSRNNKFYLKNGREYDTVAELLDSYRSLHEDMLRQACLKPENYFKFSMDPICLTTDKGNVKIKRHVVYLPATDEAVVELVLDL